MKFTETERRILVTRAEGGRNGEVLLIGTELQFCKMKSSGDCLNNMNVLNITGYLKMVKMISFMCVLLQFFLKSTISFLRYLCEFNLCKFNRRQINAPYLELIFLASLPIQTKLLPLESQKRSFPTPPFFFPFGPSTYI